LAAEYDKTEAKEMELLKQQENFVHRSCEIEKELKRKEEAVKELKTEDMKVKGVVSN
jgi:predicted phage-related endonuclease